jgi:hypothetical protein
MLTEAAILSPTNVVTFTNMNNEDQLLRFSRNTCYKSSPWATTMHLLNVTRVLQQRPTRNLPVGGGGAEARGSTGTVIGRTWGPTH